MAEKWCRTGEASQCDYLMPSANVRFMVQEWPKYGFGNYLSAFLLRISNHNAELWFKRKEFDASADFIANRMISEPDWALNIAYDIEKWSEELISKASKILKTDLTRCSNGELAKLFTDSWHWQDLSQGIGPTITWIGDADGERFSRFMIDLISQKLQKADINLDISEAFSIITTPPKESFAAQEEKELLKIASDISASINNLKDLENIEILKQKYPDAYQLINQHYQKWSWLPYGYTGPAYPIDYFLEQIAEILRNDDPKIRLKEFSQKEIILKKEQTKLISKLNLSPKEKTLIDLAQEISYTKEYRKGANYYAHFCYEKLFKEAAKRININWKQFWLMSHWEVTDTLKAGRLAVDNLSMRANGGVIYVDAHKYQILTGKDAKEFFDNLEKEQVITENITELKGTCASPGSGKGIVKIIETPEDMTKMNEGDILVSETTYPSLVPAMKKAAAIVTSAGGLTCHAAIVSRELKIPCVVGTKIANKILKDGDLVEVDANKGIIKKLYKETNENQSRISK